VSLTHARGTLGWTVTLPADQAAAAAAVARDVATRLTDKVRVSAAIEAAARQTAYPRSVYWEPHSIAQGDAGLAVLYASMDACFPGEGWDEPGHAALEAAVRGAEASDYPSRGLFSGLTGLAFAAVALSRGGARYRRLLEGLDPAVAQHAIRLAKYVSSGPAHLSVGEFDAISGLAGLSAYLRARMDGRLASALEAVLEALVSLARETKAIPAWYTPPHLLGDESMVRLYPHGNLNCGLAHGIPGPLAALTLALRDQVQVRGQTLAMHRISEWLVRNRADDAWGVNWPTAVPIPERAAEGAYLEPSRAAWCYGSPGVARALWLAGDVTSNAEWCDLAVEAMRAVYRRPIKERRIDSPTFCHGVAGLLQITLRFARDTGQAVFADAAESLTNQLIALYEPDSILGYRSFEPNGNRIDQPGLLDGPAGVALVLLSAALPVEPTWDGLFLLS
jgi:hypothetical protein